MKLTSKLFAAIACLALAWGGVACSDDDNSGDDKTVLAKPVLSQQNVQTTSFVVTWAAVPNAGSYVYTINDGTQETVTATALEATGLESGKTYVVKVKAVPVDTETYKESAWASTTVTTSTPQTTPGATVTGTADGALYEYFGYGAWTDENEQPSDAYNWILTITDNTNLRLLSIELQTESETSFAGNFPVDYTCNAGTAVCGMIGPQGQLWGCWYMPCYLTEDQTVELDLDEATIIQTGNVSIVKNGEIFDISIEVTGLYNLQKAQTEEDLLERTVKYTYSGPVEAYTEEEQGTASVKSVRIAKRPVYAFTDVNKVARQFSRRIR